MRENEILCPIWIKFCRMVGILDIYANFGDDQLKGFGMVWIPLAFVVIFTALSHYGASV